ASSAAAALPRFVPPPVTSATLSRNTPSAKTSERSTGLLTHHLHDQPLRAPAVELAIEDLLPRPQIEPAVRGRHDHLMMDEQILQVRIAVVFTAPVVAIVAWVRQQLARNLAVWFMPAGRSALVQPLERVGLDPGLVVV